MDRLPAESETELIAQLRRGDPRAFHRLVELYAPRLFGLARRLVDTSEEAEDVVQETFSGVYRSIGSFRGEASLWTWMAKILVRQSARWRRSTGSLKLKRFAEDSESSDDPTGAAEPAVGSRVGGVDARMDLSAALQTLLPEYREAFVLRELEQMSYEQMATVLSVPLGTIESRLYRARAELRRLLKDWKP